MHKALAALDHPEKKCAPIIHIAGTNGKGSTLRFLSAGLETLGYQVGTFTSPHLNCYTERIKVNNKAIASADFISAFETLKNNLAPSLHLCEFEYLCCMAFVYFSKEDLDYIILETGLGGRLDATNVCQPLLSLITSISLDHQDILGESIAEIASEKAGIIKKNTAIITPTNQDQQAVKILKKQAKTQHSPLSFSPCLNLNKHASYQAENAGLALAALKQLLTLSKEQIENILYNFNKLSIPARFEQHRYKQRKLIFDGAHNPAAIRQLMQNISTLGNKNASDSVAIILAIQKHKDAESMLNILQQFSCDIYYLHRADDLNYWPYAHIAKLGHASQIQPFTAFNIEDGNLADRKTIIFTGSLYWVAESRKRFKI
eukprot:COSAG01_NODE_6_length_54687_cov_500.907599_36_plen_374_part_00